MGIGAGFSGAGCGAGEGDGDAADTAASDLVDLCGSAQNTLVTTVDARRPPITPAVVFCHFFHNLNGLRTRLLE